ncbi:hypothetical protein FOMPIDRAFT_1053206 [Fomitopsis schrenkii]|uniref:Uncharacterized protein n=1 Tax=Fomitopsis schrenkii TaxID=2126942 RepID=S8DTJ9_FOMSC|nr:hypothetical protein FOMPIDRAFT_1053206 [Fomitopsis schrenkii]
MYFTSLVQLGPKFTKLEIPRAMGAMMAGMAISEGQHGTRRSLKETEGFHATCYEQGYWGHLHIIETWLQFMGQHKILGYIFKEAKKYHTLNSAAIEDVSLLSMFIDSSMAGMDIEL